jgi:hypothetical protein
MMNKAVRYVLVLAGAMLIVQTASAEERADQLNTQYKEAKAKKDMEHGVNYICEAAALDPKKYGKKCDSARSYVADHLKQYQADLGTGRFELQNKDYPGAIRDLRKIEFGPLRDEAQRLITQARAQQSGAPSPDDLSRQALHAAQLSYERGDFAQAVIQANSVTTDNLKPNAAQMLTNIRIYKATLAQAEALEQSGDYKAAQQKYSFATAINPNGPGSIPQRQRHLETLLNAPPPPAAQPAVPAQADAKKAKAVTAQIDNTANEKRALAEARAAEARGDDQTALARFTRVLAIDGRQSEALAGKERILNKLRGDPKALEDMLRGGIESFYSSHFIEANDAIALYLRAGGVRSKGAAHFYLGATFLSEAILAGPGDKGKQESLRQNAQQEFALAQQESYRPIENEVSPRILTEWKKSGNQQ